MAYVNRKDNDYDEIAIHGCLCILTSFMWEFLLFSSLQRNLVACTFSFMSKGIVIEFTLFARVLITWSLTSIYPKTVIRSCSMISMRQ